MAALKNESKNEFASHLIMRRIGRYLVLDGEFVSGEDYISYTYSTASAESIFEEARNPKMQVFLDGEFVSGEDYISYTYSTASAEYISEEARNPKMQVCDGELVLKTGQYIPLNVVVTPNKIHFVDWHFERKIAKSARSAFISNDRIQPWHFP